MVESNNDAERRIRIQRTLQRLVKATAELEELQHPKASADLSSLVLREPRPPSRQQERG
jgi:hypothetical protein